MPRTSHPEERSRCAVRDDNQDDGRTRGGNSGSLTEIADPFLVHCTGKQTARTLAHKVGGEDGMTALDFVPEATGVCSKEVRTDLGGH